MFKSFKPIRTDHLEITPSTIADWHGKLLVWYLPNILSPERQVKSVPYFRGLQLIQE